ncbi:MAG: methyltransferase domain-containing protein [Gemmatimonadetes bacterium]|nr:methyltransferase domain-containing protein [Gemmatimonadota bacterium]
MSQVDVFDRHVDRYEKWFERHSAAFHSELDVIRRLMGRSRPRLEIGVGSGRFAAPLGVKYGIDPSANMLVCARARGVCVACAVAEALPFRSGAFRIVLMVTTVCFLDDETRAMNEMRRVLAPGGRAVLAFVDADSPLGRRYEERKPGNVFYRGAHFVGATEVGEMLHRTGFHELRYAQTLRGDPDTLSSAESATPGHGEGGFVVVSARRM